MIVKVALVAPAATVTLAGTWAAVVLLLVRVTTAPPTGLALSKVTVPAEDVPPSTEDGTQGDGVGSRRGYCEAGSLRRTQSCRNSERCIGCDGAGGTVNAAVVLAALTRTEVET